MMKTKTKTTTLALMMTLVALPVLADHHPGADHTGMHQMPDGSWMKNHEMPAAVAADTATAKADKTVVATVNGLVCDFCAQSIKKTLMKEPGVTSVDVNLTGKTVTVGLKADAKLEEAKLKGVLAEAGYDLVGYKVN